MQENCEKTTLIDVRNSHDEDCIITITVIDDEPKEDEDEE